MWWKKTENKEYINQVAIAAVYKGKESRGELWGNGVVFLKRRLVLTPATEILKLEQYKEDDMVLVQERLTHFQSVLYFFLKGRA